MARKGIFFPLKDAALRDDVHVLGSLVGDVLKDQCGPALFAAVEGDRLAAIGRRQGDPEAAVELVVRTQGRPPQEASTLVRAFSTWFQVVNLAEKVHRVRRRRQYMNDSSTPQPGGLEERFARLKARGLSLEQVVACSAGSHRAGVHALTRPNPRAARCCASASASPGCSSSASTRASRRASGARSSSACAPSSRPAGRRRAIRVSA